MALTSQNGANSEQHSKNLEYANANGVSHFILFDGWYNELKDRDIRTFAQALVDSSKNNNV